MDTLEHFTTVRPWRWGRRRSWQWWACQWWGRARCEYTLWCYGYYQGFCVENRWTSPLWPTDSYRSGVWLLQVRPFSMNQREENGSPWLHLYQYAYSRIRAKQSWRCCIDIGLLFHVPQSPRYHEHGWSCGRPRWEGGFCWDDICSSVQDKGTAAALDCREVANFPFDYTS